MVYYSERVQESSRHDISVVLSLWTPANSCTDFTSNDVVTLMEYLEPRELP